MTTASPALQFPDIPFRWSGQRAVFGGASIDELAARYGTPLYVYDFEHIKRRTQELSQSLKHVDQLICYAVKANSSLALLKHMASLNIGADVVSGGELLKARNAGIPGENIVFSGVAKVNEELALGVSENILAFNVEAPGEIARLNAAAKAQNKKAGVSLRVNPDIDPKTHPKISTGLHSTKFGLSTPDMLLILNEIKACDHIELKGLSCHIGSQIIDLKPIEAACDYMVHMTEQLRRLGHHPTQIDLGGGLGIAYHPQENLKTPTLKQWGEMIVQKTKALGLKVLLEPGRSLVAEAGILITEVIDVKQTGDHAFVLVNAGMNDLIRPSIYDAYHHIVPVWLRSNAPIIKANIVGPVCETGDYFALDREIPKPQRGDLLCILHSGAYGYSMASNYNSRPRPAEVAVTSSGHRLIHQREKLSDLWAGELS